MNLQEDVGEAKYKEANREVSQSAENHNQQLVANLELAISNMFPTIELVPDRSLQQHL